MKGRPASSGGPRRRWWGRPYADRFPEPERSWIAEQIRSRAAGTEWVGEYQDYRKDGSRVWIDARVGRVTDTAGRPHGIIGIARDITERKRAEEQLAADLAGMRRLQEVSKRLVHDGDTSPLLREIVDAAIAITAADMGNIQLLDGVPARSRSWPAAASSRAFLEFFGTVHDGRMLLRLRHAAGRTGRDRRRDRQPVFAGKPSLDVVARRRRPGRPVHAPVRPVRSARRHAVHALPHAARPADRDLHVLDLLARQAADWIERTQAEEALRQAKEAAEAANRAKDEFLANVSHEIRTPFGAILGMTELVLDTTLTDDQRQCLETAKSAAEGLLGLVDDLLDFEKIEAGKLELVPADFSLRATLERHRADPDRAGPGQGAGTGLRHAGSGRARRPDRRRRPAAAGAAQPDRQRDQVHQAGRGGRAGGSRRRPARPRARSSFASR